MSDQPPIDAAMLLAAGFGKRMRPLTDDRPKPLIEVCGAPLIDWAAARLRAGGVARLVVNAHYLADQIAEHFADADDVTLSPEAGILETGGGVTKALALLTEGRGDAPFFVVNADALWLDGQNPAVDRLKAAWNDATMDALLLLHPTVAVDDYHGPGDYHLDPDGRAHRRAEGEVAPFLFAGLQILSPRLFADAPDGPFSLNRLYDTAQAAGRLAALVHDGEWYHVGTPDALAATEEVIGCGGAKTNTR